MVRLFSCTYIEHNNEEQYLTIGKDSDTLESIQAREIEKRDD